MKRKSKVAVAGAICALAVAVGAPAAVAQSASQQGYDESGLLGSVEQQGGGGPSGPGVTPVSVQSGGGGGGGGGGALPFTGLDIGILLALGGAAAGTGYALRRVVRNPAQ